MPATTLIAIMRGVKREEFFCTHNDMYYILRFTIWLCTKLSTL